MKKDVDTKQTVNKVCKTCHELHDSDLPNCMICRALSMIMVTAKHLQSHHETHHQE